MSETNRRDWLRLSGGALWVGAAVAAGAKAADAAPNAAAKAGEAMSSQGAKAKSDATERPRPWRAVATGFALGAAVAAAVALFVTRAPAPRAPIVAEAIGDHLRIVSAQHPLEVASSNVHNVKPWFTGRLDFVPPVSFTGDDDFQLRGGELAVFLGHKAAAFVYQRRLHTISLFVYADAGDQPRAETTSRGFHVLTWTTGGLGMALVSDIAWDDLRQLEARLR